MIITQQVQNAVNHQPGDLSTEAVPLLTGLTACGRRGNNDIPQERGRASVHLTPRSDRFRKGQRKGQDIGRSVLAAIGFIQGSDSAVAQK
jgi:hypothetical protein